VPSASLPISQSLHHPNIIKKKKTLNTVELLSSLQKSMLLELNWLNTFSVFDLKGLYSS
jgi:hypothetical protein